MVTAGPISRYASDLIPMIKVLAGNNVNKLSLDKSVDIKNIKMYYMDEKRYFLVSTIRPEMKEIFRKLVLFCINFQRLVKIAHIILLQINFIYVLGMIQLICLLRQIYYALTKSVNYKLFFFFVIVNMYYRVVNYFRDILPTQPEKVDFEGMQYGGKLWRYWMHKEPNTNFKLDITNREREVSKFGAHNYLLTQFFQG